MHKKKSERTVPMRARIAAASMGEPLHGEIFKEVLESAILEARELNRESGQSPGEFVKAMMARLEAGADTEKTLMRIFESVNSGTDISEAVPLLKRLLHEADPFSQDLISIILLHHHFKREEITEVSSLLRHENPRLSTNAIDYLGVVIMHGGDISAYMPQIIRLISHKDHGVACSAFQSVEMAAYINDDPLALGYLRAVHGNKSEC